MALPSWLAETTVERNEERGLEAPLAAIAGLNVEVLDIHHHVGADLELGHQPDLRVDIVGAGARAGDDGHRDSLLHEPVAGLAQRRQIAVGGRAAVAEILDVLDVPGIALKPAETQALAHVRRLGKRRRRLRVARAGAVQPDINIDHHVQHETGRGRSGFEGAQVIHVVGRHHQRLMVPAERHEAVDLGGRHDRRGDEQPLNAPCRQRLGLAEGGAADTQGAGV